MKVQYSLDQKQFDKFEGLLLFSGMFKSKVVETPKETQMEKVVVEIDFPRMLEKEGLDMTTGVMGKIITP